MSATKQPMSVSHPRRCRRNTVSGDAFGVFEQLSGVERGLRCLFSMHNSNKHASEELMMG